MAEENRGTVSWKDNLVSISRTSKVFEKIGRYILENEDRIVFMTAGKLAANADVSQGSVTRFCNELGYTGYGDFVRDQQKNRKKEEDPRYEHDLDRDNCKIIQLEHENLDKLFPLFNTGEYHFLVEKLASVSRVILISARMSTYFTECFAYMLGKIRNDVCMVEPETGQWNNLALSDPKETLIVAAAFPRYPRILVQKMKELKQAGFTICSVTDSQLSPLISYSEKSIVVPVTRVSVFDIYSTPFLFFRILLKDVAAAIPDIDERMKRLEELERRNGAYYSE
ncbi:MAG: MurR/RpiR family transcriptional regulator [Lachnospiraceae bacterium]|nr:MurR/RpiR family transcriptional regulator [Lachnospiraceae bacterium]